MKYEDASSLNNKDKNLTIEVQNHFILNKIVSRCR